MRIVKVDQKDNKKSFKDLGVRDFFEIEGYSIFIKVLVKEQPHLPSCEAKGLDIYTGRVEIIDRDAWVIARPDLVITNIDNLLESED